MPPTGWFYTRASKRFGPVSAAELKQLADHGELAAEELVWREGMEQWVPARRVKGLFDQEEPAAAKEEPSSLPGPGKAEPEDLPSEAAKKAEPAKRADAPRAVEPTKAAEPVKLAEPPTPAAPSVGELVPSRPVRPAFETSPSAFERAREGESRHLFDVILETARTAFNAEFVRATGTLFAMVGHYVLYVAMVMLLGTQVALGVKYHSLWAILFGIGAVAALTVLQYAARRVAGVLERLDRVTVSPMPSPVFLDCCALLSLLASMLALVGWTVFAVSSQNFGWIFPAVIAFILLQYLAVVALNPESLHLTLPADPTAGEEAIGVLSFLVKLGVRAVPVLFGVGVLWGGFLLIFAILLLAVPSLADAGALELGPDVLAQSLKAWPLPPDQHSAALAAMLLMASAACPLAAYLAFLVGHLGVELLRALLVGPAKLERLAEDNRKSGNLMP